MGWAAGLRPSGPALPCAERSPQLGRGELPGAVGEGGGRTGTSHRAFLYRPIGPDPSQGRRLNLAGPRNPTTPEVQIQAPVRVFVG